MDTTEVATTFPRRLLQHGQLRPGRPAFREKQWGIWQTWNWAEVNAEVRALACGLAALGFGRGMNLAVIGDNRPRLYWAMLAAQCLGGAAVPLYQDAPAAELAYALENAAIAYAIVEDQEQVDKLLETQALYPHLRHIAYDDARGMRHYDQAQLLSCAALQALGRAHDAAHPGFYAAEIAAGEGLDCAVILYTSGTTGQPKGVCQSHAALLAAGRGGVAFDRLGDTEEILSYLPMAWVGDCLFSLAQAMVAGFTVNCPESPDTVQSDMREIGPTCYFAPPRVFEAMLTGVTIRMADAGPLKRHMFRHFMALAKRCGAAILDRKPVPALDRTAYALGHVLVYGPLKNMLGLSRVRVAYTAGAAIGPELFRFYRSLGVNLKQLYGSTETCAYVCLQADGEIGFDSVGRPAPGVQVKLAANGEVLVKSAALMSGYFGQPEASAAAIDADGYFHTGDAGLFDPAGHLKIIDRAADVGRMNDGALFAPNHIENKLKFSPYIKEAVAFGHRRDRVCAIINIDLEAVGDWAERRAIAYSGYADLAARAETYALIGACIGQVNAELAGEAALAGAQIRRFLILHKELDPDDGELTRTRKVRRAFIADKYAVLVEALYQGRASQYIETPVRFEDGRTGLARAELRLCDSPAPSGLAA
ncbi:long-chain acyl-CoA synthetase [Oxalobacteraceae bacterium GrIS 1.11]